MKFKSALVGAATAIIASASVVAAQPEIPSESLGDIGTFAAYEKFRIYSEVCGELTPESKAEFDAVMLAFSERMKQLGDEVLATEELSTMRTQAVPRSLVDAFEQEFESTRAMHRSRVPTSEGCRAAHENFAAASDNHWKAGIAMALTELRETGKPFASAPHN